MAATATGSPKISAQALNVLFELILWNHGVKPLPMGTGAVDAG